MKKTFIIVFGLSGFLSSPIMALPTPQYLYVKHWKSCVGTRNMGSWSEWCLPDKKPVKCPAASWKELTQKKLLSPCHDAPQKDDESSM